jgi:anti-sigma-K factor RskA
MADEDFDPLAAEYVLGTLTAEERTAVEQLAATDPAVAERIAAWERRLGVLEAMVAPVEPPPEVWTRIREAIATEQPEAALRLPEVAEATPLRSAPPDRRSAGNVIVLRQRVRRWRAVSGLVGAIAAVLALAIGLGRYRPELLPPALQPPVRTQVVEVVKEVPAPPAPTPAQFVAVLQRDATAPAFVLTVDLQARTLTVRRVADAPEAGKSYELWLVSSKFPGPRSLGLVGGSEFTKPALASFEPETIHDATYAVSLEPAGGSPTGAPTGPVLFTGKLVEAVPPSTP